MKRGSDDERQRGRDRRIEPFRVAGGHHACRAASRRRAAGRPPRATRRSASRPGPATPASTNGSARSTCEHVGDAMLTASTRPATSDARVNAVVPYFAGDLLRAAGLGVDDADQLDAVHRRQQPGVVLAEVTDADDRNAQVCSCERWVRMNPRCGRSCRVSPAHDRDPGIVGGRKHRVAVEDERPLRRPPRAPSRRPRASPQSSRRRRPARRSACPASASPP